MDPEDIDFTSDKNCPKCGRLADHRLPAVGWNRCKHCRLYFDDDGTDMNKVNMEHMEEIFARRDKFHSKLLYHARNHLADEPAEHPVKQLLGGMDLSDPSYSLSTIALNYLVHWTQEYQQAQRPNLDPQEELDPFAFYDSLTQVFVIDFIAECQRFLDSLSPVDRQMFMNCSHWNKPSAEAWLKMMKLIKGYR